jgi:hypothetical protein
VDAEWRPRLEVALDLFADRAPAAATQLASAVLSLNRRNLSDATGERLAALAPISDSELRRKALAKASGRLLSAREVWLAPLAPGEMDRSTITALSGVATTTWTDVLDKGVEPGESLDGVLAQLERLAASETEIDTSPLDKAFAESLQAEAVDDPGSERLALAASTADRLVSAGLGDRGIAASLLATAFAGALSVVPEGDPNGRSNLSRAFSVIAPQLADAKEEALRSLLEHAEGSAAETLGPLRVETMVAAAAALHHSGAEFDSDAVQEAVVAQIETSPDNAVGAATSWVQSGVLVPMQLWALLHPYWSGELPGPLRQAAMSATHQLDEHGHQELARLAFDRVFVDGVPAPSNWEAIDLRGLPASWVIDELAARSKAEDLDDSGWRAILEICKQLTSGVAEIQRRIGEELLIPLASRDDDGFRLAVDHLGLVGKGKNGQSVIDTFSRLATSEERRKLLSRQLGEDEGLMRSLTKGLYKRIFGETTSLSAPNDSKGPGDSAQAESESEKEDRSLPPDGDGEGEV